MRIRLHHLLSFAAVTAACADGPPPLPTGGVQPTALADDAPAFVEREVIAALDGIVTAGVPIEVAGQRLLPVTELPSGAWLLRLLPDHRRAAHRDAMAATLDAVEALRADPAVDYAHANVRFELSVVPNDPLYPQQAWHFGAIRLPAAWDRTTGASGVRIAIIDTGRRDHPELTSRWRAGFDFVDNDSDPTDPGTWAHGVHVAGLIGAATDDGVGTAGICWSCQLIPLRVSPTIAQVEQAVAWAAGPDGSARRADVINMSFNLTSAASCDTYPGLRNAITRAITRGVVVVASAGNQSDGSGAHVPANCPGVIGVAASQPDGALASYSNRGADVDVVAPGGANVNGHGYGAGLACPPDPNTFDPYEGTLGALSTWSIGTSHCHRYLAGTSMAAPHVAGVVGLMRAAHPTLTPAQIEATLRATARPSAVACPSPGACGAGLIDAAAAVAGLAPEIEVTPTSIDFPPVQVGAAWTETFQVRNLGTAPLAYSAGLTSSEFTLSCAGGACPATVAPGATQLIAVTFVPPVSGPRTGAVHVVSNDADEPLTVVELRGTATAPVITVAPASLAFGSRPVNTASTLTLTIGNSGTAPLVVTGVAAPDAYGVSGPVPATIPVGGSTTYAVSCVRPTVGVHDANLIVYNTSGVAAVVPLTCAATAPPGPLLLVAPASGELLIRPGQLGTVTVGNPGTAPITIAALGFGDDRDSWFHVANIRLPATVEPGQTRSWSIGCTPRTRAGVHWEKHVVVHDGVDSGSLLVVGCDTGPYRDEVGEIATE